MVAIWVDIKYANSYREHVCSFRLCSSWQSPTRIIPARPTHRGLTLEELQCQHFIRASHISFISKF